MSVFVGTAIGEIAVDTTSLYYASGPDLDSVPLTGGTSTKLNSPDGFDALSPAAFCLDSQSVYWTSAASPDTGYVVSVSKGGTGQRELLNELATYGDPYPIAAQLGASGVAESVVWVTRGDGQSTSHPIVGQSFPGGGSGSIAELPVLFANSVALDSANAYVTSQDGLDVYKVPLAGGAPTVFASGLVTPAQIVTDTQNAYVLDLGTEVGSAFPNGKIIAFPLAGGASVILASSLPNIAQIAVAGGHVYATSTFTASSSASDGAVLAIPVTGGAPVVLASGQPSPAALTVDATYVYWVTRGTTTSTVWKTPR